MSRHLLGLVIVLALAHSVLAGAGGLVVKGVFKTWDEIAKVALKVSGKAVTDDAVKVSARTIEEAASRYGDDVAKAAVRGGVEVAEQSMKHGGRFVRCLNAAATYSDDAVKAIARNGGDVVKYVEKYGDDAAVLASKAPGTFTHGITLIEKSGVENVGQTLKIVATQIPKEQIPQVFGAIQKNPTVAKEFLDGVSKGGKDFVDRICTVNWKQILAGTLGSGAIITAVNLTAPQAAEGEAIRTGTKKVIELVGGDGHLTDLQQWFVDTWIKTTSAIRRMEANRILIISLIGAAFAGVALLVYVIRKTRK